MNEAEGYCMRCRAKRTIKNPRNDVSSNGRNRIRGVCPVCKTKMYKFI